MMVLITGASGGLGRALALDCAKRGFDLYLTDISQEHLNRIRNGILRQYDVNISTEACNLTNPSQVSRLFENIAKRNIYLDMLLNVAGIDHEGNFMNRDCNEITEIVRLNVEATLRATHHALARRRPGKRFYLLFVSSLASLYPIPLKATYAASKRFILDFSQALRQEQMSNNINVLCVCPGGLPTTRDSIEGIAAQGVWGNLTTNKVELVAHKSIAKVISGKSLYIPGFINCALRALGMFLPRKIIAKLLYKRWSDAHSKRLKLD